MALTKTKEHETASGFIDGLNEAGLSAQSWDQFGTRPIVQNVPPLGRSEGDGAVLIGKEGQTSLIILELEASSPGNERNILKWAVPDALDGPLKVRPGRNGEAREFAFVEVVLCFGREAQGTKKSDWADSDFVTTVAHCDFLANLLNNRSDTPRIHFTILSAGERVEDWSAFGRTMAAQFVEQQKLQD